MAAARAPRRQAAPGRAARGAAPARAAVLLAVLALALAPAPGDAAAATAVFAGFNRTSNYAVTFLSETKGTGAGSAFNSYCFRVSKTNPCSAGPAPTCCQTSLDNFLPSSVTFTAKPACFPGAKLPAAAAYYTQSGDTAPGTFALVSAKAGLQAPLSAKGQAYLKAQKSLNLCLYFKDPAPTLYLACSTPMTLLPTPTQAAVALAMTPFSYIATGRKKTTAACQISGNVDVSSTYVCSDGQGDPGNRTCAACPPGTAGKGLKLGQACAACAGNTIAAAYGASACDACPAGKVASADKTACNPLPDFQPVSLTLLSTPVKGVDFGVRVVIRNNGGDGDVGTVKFVLYGDGYMPYNSTTDVPCGSTDGLDVTPGVIPAGGNITVEDMYSSFTAGWKQMRVIVDAYCVTNETNKRNNQIAYEFKINGTADLSVSGGVNVNFADTTLSPGDPVQFIVRVNNIGDDDSTPTTVAVWWDLATDPTGCLQDSPGTPQPDFWVDVPALPPFSEITTQWSTLVNVTLPSATGYQRTVLYVDPNCTVPETNENNLDYAGFTISPLPDLYFNGYHISPAKPIAGQSFSIQFTISNKGASSSQPSTLRAWGSDVGTQDCGATAGAVADATVPLVVAGGNQDVTINLQAPAAAGLATFHFVVDADCAVSETTKLNNQFTLNFTVASIVPDLTVVAISSAPPSVPDGQSVKFMAFIGNAGNGSFNGTVALKIWVGASGVKPACMGGPESSGGVTPATVTQYLSIPAGGNVSIDFSPIYTASAATPYVTVAVDSSCSITELLENNNVATTQYSVVQSSSLPNWKVSTALLMPVNPVAGYPFQVVTLLYNGGLGAGVPGRVAAVFGPSGLDDLTCATAAAANGTADAMTVVGSGDKVTAQIKFPAPSSADVGTSPTAYTLVDATCTSNETAYDDNTYNVGVDTAIQSASALADFQVKGVTIYPSNPVVGQAVFFTASIANLGAAKNSYNAVWLYLCNETASDCASPRACGAAADLQSNVRDANFAMRITTDPADYVQVRLKFYSLADGTVKDWVTYSTPGVKYAQLFVDPECLTPESDETNNWYSFSFTVTSS